MGDCPDPGISVASDGIRSGSACLTLIVHQFDTRAKGTASVEVMPDADVIQLFGGGRSARPTTTGLAPRRERPATYVVRMSLDESEPEVWRRLELDSSLDLRSVHRILQATMGWLDSHLHEFTTPRSASRLLADSEVDEGEVGTPERDVHLDEVLHEVGDLLAYAYDFGDGWDHTVVLEAIRPEEPERPVRVLAGDRACPVEDSGGAGTWNAYVRWLVEGDADDLEQEWLLELAERVPLDFDATHFEAGEAQAAAEAAALTTHQLALRLPPHPDVRGLAASLPEEGVRLLAGLSRAEPPPPVDTDEALRPLLVLLRLVREGLDLTPTGQMKQVRVRALLDDLGWGGDWVFGRTLHEENLPPVRWIRHAAHVLGLVRRRSGRLVLTPLGRDLHDDANGLWRHLVASLPVGESTEERRAGALWLLTLREGRASYETYDRCAEVVFDMAARQAGERSPSERQVHEWHRPTLWLMLVLEHDHTSHGVLPAQAAAAHAALWGIRD
jgi:hypothetical protein